MNKIRINEVKGLDGSINFYPETSTPDGRWLQQAGPGLKPIKYPTKHDALRYVEAKIIISSVESTQPLKFHV